LKRLHKPMKPIKQLLIVLMKPVPILLLIIMVVILVLTQVDFQVGHGGLLVPVSF